MTIHISDLKIIALNGGGMMLDARKHHVSDLKIIALNAASSGAKIYLHNIDAIHVSDLKIIALNSKGCVIFNLLEN